MWCFMHTAMLTGWIDADRSHKEGNDNHDHAHLWAMLGERDSAGASVLAVVSSAEV